ncbi:hypothetical protein [Leptospira santarosai]|uniref:hypothetical protein n=1 Tax=Leptospira santarosai TaxID=28183 RepID=UPI0024AFCACD|nr:hypothetical protein [Leptospira santarosai]MDI7200111.1 hypothetical protein [Leptospira santarosai]MDI7213761.1 hypothetical protein [Leptospira santarosai]
MNSLRDAYIVDSFLEDIKSYDKDQILSFIESHSDIQERIIERKNNSLIFGQPLVIQKNKGRGSSENSYEFSM